MTRSSRKFRRRPGTGPAATAEPPAVRPVRNHAVELCVDAVASGVPYIVTSVNAGRPTDVHDFVSAPVVSLTAAFHLQVIEIRGTAVLDGDTVLVYEKDRTGTGKDVRTWQIGRREDMFVATERSMF